MTVEHVSAEPLLHQESQRSSGLRHREPDPAEHGRKVVWRLVLPSCRQVSPLHHFPLPFLFCRGRVIPADLEAKVIEAKQKVKISHRDLLHLFK